MISAYILIVVGFAVVYDSINASSEDGFWNNLYFSFSTITTIGYGDIAPVRMGHLFAGLQMIYGILYQVLAVSIGVSYLTNLTKKGS